jgi:hypothetical protein
MVMLSPHDDGTITITIQAPDALSAADRPRFRPTHYMQQISELLENSDGESKRAIRDAIKGRNEHIDIAVDRLAEEGYVAREPGRPIRSLRPYRRISEQQIPDRAHRAPTVPRGARGTLPGGSGETRAHRAPRCAEGTSGTGERGTPPGQAGHTQEPLTAPDARCCTGCGEDHDPASPCFPQPGREP